MFTPPADIERLAIAIGSVTTSAELRMELGGRALERAAGFSWDRCAGETLDVYHDAVAESGHTGFR
jgi:alpha-1,3-rhamnosyl/mannosyltransferase